MLIRLVLIVVISAFSLAAQTLRITGGIADDQVLQRDSAGRATARITGTAERADGRAVEARVLRKHNVVDGLDWQPAGKISGGKWVAEVKDLPTGGPYRIELRAAGSADVQSVSDVLVGDLWILAGQSNMQGVGNLVDVEQPHDLVHSFDMADRWIVAEEPLHVLGSASDRVHWPLNAQKVAERLEGDRLRKSIAARVKGAGLGLPFAVEMVRRTGVPVGLVPCAHGGTSMDQWDPALKSKGGDSLYGSMFRRFEAAGSKVKGVLWYQGESDANPKAVDAFAQKFENLVAAIREDFRQPDLPFYYVQLGRHVSDANAAEWNAVQEAQRLAEAKLGRAGVVAAVDLALDDQIHVGTPGLKRLGRRMALLAVHDLFPDVRGAAGFQRGPRPVSAEFKAGVIRVTFSGVNGRLTSDGRVSGFSVHAASGERRSAIYRAEFDSTAPNVVLLHVGGKLPEGATLRYGWGKDPYCNVRDSADVGLVAFGPLPIQQQ